MNKKLQVEKRSEIVMTSAAFQQMLRTLKEVEEKLKDQLEQQQKKAASRAPASTQASITSRTFQRIEMTETLPTVR